MCIALDSEHSQRVDARGVQVLFGNGLAERTLKRAETATRVGALGLTENDALNLLFVREARARNQVGQFAALHHPSSAGITRETLLNSGCQVLFGGPRPLQQWCGQIEAGRTSVQWWTWDPNRKAGKRNSSSEEWKRKETLLPLVHAHGKQVTPVDGASILRPGDEVAFLVQMPWDEGVMTSLQSEGWRPKSPGEVAEARSLEAELSRTEEVPIEGPHLRSRRQKFPSLSTLPSIRKCPLFRRRRSWRPPRKTAPISRRGHNPEQGGICGISGRRRCRSTIAIGGSGGRDSSRARFLGGRERTRSRAGTLDGGFRTCAAGRTPFHSFRGSGLPEKGEPAGEIPEPPIAETIASPKDEESSNEAHEKPVSMPEEKPSLENQEEIPVSLPSLENVPPDAAESSNERESEPDTDAKGDPGEPFSLITPEDIPAASSRKQRARVPVRPKPRDSRPLKFRGHPSTFWRICLCSVRGRRRLRIRRPHPSRRKDRKKRTDGQERSNGPIRAPFPFEDGRELPNGDDSPTLLNTRESLQSPTWSAQNDSTIPVTHGLPERASDTRDGVEPPSASVPCLPRDSTPGWTQSGLPDPPLHRSPEVGFATAGSTHSSLSLPLIPSLQGDAMTVLAPSSQTIYHRAVRSTVCPSPPLRGFPGGLRLSGLKKTNVSQCNQVIDRDRFSALEMYFPCDSLNVLLHRGIPSARACFSLSQSSHIFRLMHSSRSSPNRKKPFINAVPNPL